MRDGELTFYLQEINRTPLLSPEAENDLARRAQAGDKAAADHFLQANLRLVVYVARHFQGRGLEITDLIGWGNLGLIRALRKYDPERGTRFSTYACSYIAQKIREGLGQSTTIRRPMYLKFATSKWCKARARLCQRGIAQPNNEQIAAELGWSQRRTRTYLENAPRGIVPFQPVHEPTYHHESQLERNEENEELLKALKQLCQRHQTVLTLTFGLDGKGSRTLATTGKALGVTRERVRQIRDEALENLRSILAYLY